MTTLPMMHNQIAISVFSTRRLLGKKISHHSLPTIDSDEPIELRLKSLKGEKVKLEKIEAAANRQLFSLFLSRAMFVIDF